MITTPPEALDRLVSTLINTVLNLEKSRTFVVRGRRIYPSEVHLLLLLADQPAANATELARMLGLTKGAVSQTITRLVEKGLLTKTRDPASKNALALSFTTQGDETAAYFRDKTAQMQARVARHTAALGEDERRAIGEFLARLSEALEAMGSGE